MLFAHPTLGHAFVREKSIDGKISHPVTEEKLKAIRSPHVANKIGKAKYIRIRINEGTPAIWEVKIYG